MYFDDDYLNFSSNVISRVQIVQATDDDIIKEARGKVENDSDVSLRGQHITPIRGGLYDPNIFGAPEQCYCGRIRTIHEYCPSCHTKVYTSNEYAEGYAYYTMHVPYVTLLRIGLFVDWLNKIGINVGFTSRATRSAQSMLKHLWSITVNITPIKEQLSSEEYDIVEKATGIKCKLEITDLQQTDHYNFGLIGLLALKDYKTKDGVDLVKVRQFINTQLMITSPAQRMYSVFHESGGQPKITIPRQTLRFRTIIYFDKIITGLMEDMYDQDVDRATLCYLMNDLIFINQQEESLISTSKESLIRNLVPTRVTESGRSTIIGDPSLGINEVGVPESMLYQMLDSKIIDKMKADGIQSARQLYLNADPIALQAMHDIVDQSLVLFCRNPSLHKYNIMAFKPIPHSGIEIRCPLLVLEGFNADFDGDQMWLQMITEPDKVQSFMSMLPSNNWYYEKSFKSPYLPNSEILLGLYEASKRLMPNKMHTCSSFEDLAEKVRTDVIKCNELVHYDDRVTTYGLELYRQVLGTDLDTAMGSKDPVIITDDNINKLVAWIGSHDDRVRMLHDLQEIGTEIATKIGVDTAPFVDILGGSGKEIKQIAEGKDPAGVKVNKIKSKLTKEMISKFESLPDTNFDELRKSGAKFKESAIRELYGPTVILKKDGTVKIDNTNLFTGLSQRAYTELAGSNRYILELKQDL